MTHSDDSLRAHEAADAALAGDVPQPQGAGLVPGFPSRASVDMLRKALRSPRHGAIFASALQVAVRMICADAHRVGLPVERVLVRLKETWRTLPEAQPEPWGYRNNVLLERVVSMCIREYYAGCDDT